MTETRSDSQNQTVRLLAVPVKVAVATCVSISIGGVVWSCLAKVPIYANGVAILMPINKSKILISQHPGTVVYLTEHTIHQNDQTRLLYDFGMSNKNLNKKETVLLAEYALSLSSNMPKANSMVSSKQAIPPKSLLSMIDSADAKGSLQQVLTNAKSIIKQNQTSQNQLIAIDNNIKRKILAKQTELAHEKKFLLAIQRLNAEGYTSEVRLLNQEVNVVKIENEIISLQEQLEANQIKLTQLDNAGNESVAVLAKALRFYIGNNLIFSGENHINISNIIASNSTEVGVNSPILRVTINQAALDDLFVIPGYVDEASSQRVLPGMKALLTPVGMSRAQYGGFYGTVQSSDLLPQSQIGLMDQLGDSGAVSEINSQLPRPVQVNIKLEHSDNQSDPNKASFLWSSSGKLPYPVREGNRLSLQITTQEIRPISLLIPWLRKIIGESPTMIQATPSN